MHDKFLLLILCILLLQLKKKNLFIAIIVISLLYYLYLKRNVLFPLKKQSNIPKVPMTEDNPFANNLPFIEKGDPPFILDTAPIQYGEDALKQYIDSNENKEMKDLYYEDVFRPLEDYYDKKSAYRQFYNNPDVEGFVDFVYGDMKSCKDTATTCFPYYDNRYNRY